jgi:hypothetical protein
MGMVAWALICYSSLWWYYAKVNKRRANGEEDHLIAGMSDLEVAEMGDDSPRFQYTI